MSIWKWMLSLIGLRTNARSRSPKNTNLRLHIRQIAEHESRPEPEIVHELLVAGLHKYYSHQDVISKWELLSARQKEVALLIEKGMTNEQIALRLGIALPTVKTHVANILLKLQANEKSDVRHMLGVMKRNHWI